MENVFIMSANDMAQSVNAHIGITAYGKAFFFSKNAIAEVCKGLPEGETLQMVHLIQICREAGKEIPDERFSISLVSLDTTEEEWFESVNKPLDDDDDDDEEYEEDDDEYEDEDDD